MQRPVPVPNEWQGHSLRAVLKEEREGEHFRVSIASDPHEAYRWKLLKPQFRLSPAFLNSPSEESASPDFTSNHHQCQGG